MTPPPPVLCKLTLLPVIAVLFLATIPCLSAAEEISESWGVARLHSRAATAGEEPGAPNQITTNAEEVLRDDIPEGKRAFKLPQGSFIRFNPVAGKNEPRDLSFTKTVKAWVYAESQANITTRIAGRFLKTLKHLGGGWELLEWNLEWDFQEPAFQDQQKRQNLLAGVTLIDVIASHNEFGGDEVLISGLVAAE